MFRGKRHRRSTETSIAALGAVTIEM